MAFDIFINDPILFNTLSKEFTQNGLVVLSSISLPDVFEPPQTDVVFLGVNGNLCEVYIGSNVQYRGRNQEWQSIQGGAVQPGKTRFVARIKGDFHSGLRLFRQKLIIANDSPPKLPEALSGIDSILGLDGKALEMPRKGRFVYEIPKEEKERDFKMSRFGRDLTKMAREGKLPAVIGRKREMESLLVILSKKEKPNAVLVGNSGTGKSTIVYGLAQRIVKAEVPPSLKRIRIIEINSGYLMAGAGIKGEVENRIKEIIEEAESNPHLVIFFDELQSLLGARGDIPVVEILKPALARGGMRVIAACTPRDFRKIETDGALSRRFEKIIVNEPNEEETLQILEGLRADLEDHHGIEIPDEILQMAIDVSGYYFLDRSFPDKALGLIDEAAARVSMETSKMSKVGQPADSIEDIKREIEQAIEEGDYATAKRLNELLKKWSERK
ncbi:MAG: AAA family ATPase [Candidatus Eremiobacteraeota bacterium]|nr:AAA family ATPase [Candidatus Eremiobacteraeota bacterium]